MAKNEQNNVAKNYKMVATPNHGRIMVAATLIKCQEKIITDEAPVVAPILFSGQVNFQPGFFCIHCFKNCMGNKKCPKCRLPICEKACAKSKTHLADCPVLRDLFDDEEDPERKNQPETIEERFQHLMLAASCISALRFIRLKRSKKSVGFLANSRNPDIPLPSWETDIIDMLTGCFIDGKANPILEQEVIEALGVWATNGVKVQRSSAYMPCVVLFPEFCLFNHRCNPKAMYVPYFGEKSFLIEARAQVDIQPGEEITIRYTDALSTNWERRKACIEKWNFSCKCERCEDMTEFGTFTSGVVCCQCETGTLLIDSLDKNWTCFNCKATSSHSEIWFSLLDPLHRSKSDCISQKADDSIIEQWIWTAQKMLHPNHVWILDMEYRLLFMYAKKLKCMKKGKKPFQLRMIHVGLHLLEVLGKIDEGPTRWRGMVLQEMVSPWMELAKHDKAFGIIDSYQFKRKVILAMLHAQNAVECLKFDPKNANMNLENFSLHS